MFGRLLCALGLHARPRGYDMCWSWPCARCPTLVAGDLKKKR